MAETCEIAERENRDRPLAEQAAALTERLGPGGRAVLLGSVAAGRRREDAA